MSNPLSIQVKACKKLVGIALAFISFHGGVGGLDKMNQMNLATGNVSQSTRITGDSDIRSRNFKRDILLGSLVGIITWLILVVLIMTY